MVPAVGVAVAVGVGTGLPYPALPEPSRDSQLNRELRVSVITLPTATFPGS